MDMQSDILGLQTKDSDLESKILALESSQPEADKNYWTESDSKLTTTYALDVNDIYANDGIFVSLTADTLNIGSGKLENKVRDKSK